MNLGHKHTVEPRVTRLGLPFIGQAQVIAVWVNDSKIAEAPRLLHQRRHGGILGADRLIEGLNVGYL